MIPIADISPGHGPLLVPGPLLIHGPLLVPGPLLIHGPLLVPGPFLIHGPQNKALF